MNHIFIANPIKRISPQIVKDLSKIKWVTTSIKLSLEAKAWKICNYNNKIKTAIQSKITSKVIIQTLVNLEAKLPIIPRWIIYSLINWNKTLVAIILTNLLCKSEVKGSVG